MIVSYKEHTLGDRLRMQLEKDFIPLCFEFMLKRFQFGLEFDDTCFNFDLFLNLFSGK